MARNTKYAASVGTSRCTTKLVTNCATSVWKAREPSRRDPSTWQRHGYSKRSEPAQQRLKGQEHDCPEHPLGEPPADGERHRSLAAQTDAGNHQGQ